MWRVISAGLAFCALWAPLAAQTEAVNPSPSRKPSLLDYELVQFISAGRLPPERVIRLDNNAEILLACRADCSLSGLETAGVEATASQLELLRVMNLVHPSSRDEWTTSIPVLEAEQVAELRAQARSIAAEAFGDLRPHFDALSGNLQAGSLESHAYAIFFSYVLDGMVWGFLEEYMKVPLRRLSAAHPFWSGEIWALESAPANRLATTVISDRGVSLRILGSRVGQSAMGRLSAGRKAVKRALGEYLESGQVDNAEAIELLAALGIVDDGGGLLIPVIVELGAGDPVFESAERLTSELVDWLLENVDVGSLESEFELRSDSLALVMIYHEVMSSLMRILEDAAIVQRPAALDQPDTVSPGELGKLVVLVDRADRRERGDTDSESGEDKEEES